MNMLINYLPIIQIILSILLIIIITLQQSEESLGGAFGGSDSVDTVKRTRRGGEKVMFNTALVIAILFIITSVITLLVK